MKFGGAERDRTADPLLAKQVLSQLSYSPSCGCSKLAGSLAGANPSDSQKTSLIAKRVSRTRLNMLDGYAVRDHRAMVIKQRRLVSEFPRSPSGTAIAG